MSSLMETLCQTILMGSYESFVSPAAQGALNPLGYIKLEGSDSLFWKMEQPMLYVREQFQESLLSHWDRR